MSAFIAACSCSSGYKLFVLSANHLQDVILWSYMEAAAYGTSQDNFPITTHLHLDLSISFKI